MAKKSNVSTTALFESVGGPLRGGGKYAVAAKQSLALSRGSEAVQVGAMHLEIVPGKGKGLRRPGNAAIGENLIILFRAEKAQVKGAAPWGRVEEDEVRKKFFAYRPNGKLVDDQVFGTKDSAIQFLLREHEKNKDVWAPTHIEIGEGSKLVHYMPRDWHAIGNGGGGVYRGTVKERRRVFGTNPDGSDKVDIDYIPHGHGTLTWSDCWSYQGQWHNGKMNGWGCTCWPAEGGESISSYPQTCGQWHRNHPHGFVSELDTHGRMTWHGEFYEGERWEKNEDVFCYNVKSTREYGEYHAFGGRQAGDDPEKFLHEFEPELYLLLLQQRGREEIREACKSMKVKRIKKAIWKAEDLEVPSWDEDLVSAQKLVKQIKARKKLYKLIKKVKEQLENDLSMMVELALGMLEEGITDARATGIEDIDPSICEAIELKITLAETL